MKTMEKNRVINLNRFIAVTIAITICFTMVPGFKSEARAGKGAAFLGGMIAGHVVGGMVRRSRIRTAAEVHQAYGQPQTVQQAAPAAKPTAQQRLDQLNKLAAGGYITPQEYKAKKKAILDSM